MHISSPWEKEPPAHELSTEKEPPLPGPLLHKYVEEREMERCATGSWVQWANGFGEISLRLFPHARRERSPTDRPLQVYRRRI
jgi:hypothetical protein